MNTSFNWLSNTKLLEKPYVILDKYPVSQAILQHIAQTRQSIVDIVAGKSNKLLVIIGPCSIHDQEMALAYAKLLKTAQTEFQDTLEIVMRTYFEKPRTTVGWKGFINDPHLNGTNDVNNGLLLARKLLIDINAMGLPTAGEFLDTTFPLYLGDLMSWGAIGARTTESQIHRSFVSGVKYAVGFKNPTSGNVKIAVDSVVAARACHSFPSMDLFGRPVLVTTEGNPHTHIIMRGGVKTNYHLDDLHHAKQLLLASSIDQPIMVDFSHANSLGDYRNQLKVAKEVATIIQTTDLVSGVMIESNLHAGKQPLTTKEDLAYGVSITDGCISFAQSYEVLKLLHTAIQQKLS